MHILAPNGTAETYPYSIGQLRRDNPQISFPKNPTDQLLAAYGVYPLVRTERPEYNTVTHNLTEGTPEKVEGVWVQTWLVTEATPEEVQERLKNLSASVRADRDRRLQETDWVVIKAYERNENIPAEWEVYRQALRDVPSQPSFPHVVWPVKPE
jgi:hypothetical protein